MLSYNGEGRQISRRPLAKEILLARADRDRVGSLSNRVPDRCALRRFSGLNWTIPIGRIDEFRNRREAGQLMDDIH